MNFELMSYALGSKVWSRVLEVISAHVMEECTVHVEGVVSKALQ